MLNLKYLAPAVQTVKEPVLMIAGTGCRASLFNPPTANLLEVLSSKGFDRNPSKAIAAVAERSCGKLLKELPRRLAYRGAMPAVR
jgi:hypothetical protein